MKTLTACAFAALLSASLPAAADTAPLTLPQILDRWADALGGRERLAAVHGLHLQEAIATGGLTGSYQSWSDAHGSLHTSVHLGDVIHEDDILAGGQGWVRDISGLTHASTGTDLESLVSEAYEASDSQLLPGRMPGQVEFMGVDAMRHAYVLKLAPAGGTPVTVYLDMQSFLPQAESIVQGGQTQTTSYTAWKAVDGLQFPAAARQSTGDPKYDVLITLSSVELNPTLDPTLFSKPDSTAAEVTYGPSGHVLHIPFDFFGGHIYVPVSVNGAKPAPFIFDTGAEASAVEQSHAAIAGLKSQGALEMGGSGSSDTMGMATGVSFGIGDARVPTQAVAVLPLGGLAPVIGRPLAGIVGFDVISRFVVQIDYAARILTLYDPAVFHYAGKGAVLPFTFLGNDLQLPVRVVLPGQAPIATVANLDTGANSSELSSHFVDQYDVLHAVGKTLEHPGYGLGGSYESFDGRIAAIQVGPYTLKDPVVGLSRAKQGTLSRADLGINLGSDVLTRFTVTLDYARQQLILEPNSTLDAPFPTDASGLMVLAKGADFRTFEIISVLAGSAGSDAGLQKGDVIESVDGKPAAQWDRSELQALFMRDGRRCRLVIRRGNRDLDVELRLRKLL